MFARPDRNGEATGLAVRPGACVVRLRTSPVERLVFVLRAILGVAFGIAVLWLGGVFLSCTASTAAAVPVQTVVYGAVKGGKDRAAGGRASGSSLLLLSASDDDEGGSGGGDSDGGDSDEGDSDEGDSEKKESDEKDSDEKDSEKKDSEKKESEKKDSEDDESEKNDSEKKSSEKKESEKNESEKNDSDEKDADSSSSESENRASEREKVGTSEARNEDSDEDRPADAPASDDERSESDERSDSQPAPSGSEADQDDAADDATDDERDDESTDSEGDVDGDAGEGARESYDKIAADRASQDSHESRDEDDSEGADSGGADSELSDDDAADLAESAADLAEDISDDATERALDLVEETTHDDESSTGDEDGPARDGDTGDDVTSVVDEARDVVDALTDDASAPGDQDASDAETDERSDAEDRSESVSVLAAEAADQVEDADVRAALDEASGSDSDDSRSDADEATLRHAITDAADELAAGEDQDTQQALLGAGEPADARGPPAETVALFSADDEDESRESDEDEDRDDRDEDKDYDDSPELTEQVLEDRIEVDNSKEELEREKAKVASGETSQADYDKKAAEHAEREKRAAENRDELSPDRVEMVDEVVDGHRELSEREKELAAEEERVASGAADRETHDQNVADFEERRDDVYEATEELMEATDREVRTVSEDDLDGEGSAAGCDADGAFVGCGSASESADGERDSERRLCLSGVSGCGASSESGGSKAEASCDDTGCGSSASSRGADGRETRSSARCDGGRDCEQSSRATPESASAECESGGGTCRSESSGSGRDSDESATDRDTVRLATHETTETRVAGASSAHCESDTGCGTSSRVDVSEDGDVVADAETGCDTGCTGSARTNTDASVVAATSNRESAAVASADCSANGGSCSARSDSRAGSEDGDLSASSSAGGSVDCAAGCTGSATGATNGKTTGRPATVGGVAPVRETSGTSSCTATAGGCAAESASEVGDVAAQSRSVRNADDANELYATSVAGATVSCAIGGCAGTGDSATSGAASGDVAGVRDSTGSSSCTARGAGGTCSTTSDTLVSDREPAPGDTVAGVVPVTGPVSVSNASASVECTGAATECGGTATSATSARDTAVTPDARGTSASTECTVTGGGCAGTASSAASSAGDFVATDPSTGLPLPGQPTSGPSSTATANASVVCAPGAACTGSVRTSTTAWDGGVTRTSEGTASCTGATGGCDVQSVSTASSGPGAALALSAGPQQVNAARLPAGPSAASAAGAAMTCAGEIACTGSVTSAATATDPLVSPTARGSHGEGSCEGVTGGVCQAVTNSGASSDPSANVITPLVAERSTANATVSSGTTGDAPQGAQPQQEQPVAPVPTAPGSSANSGAPTVPGASSWTMANATLDCSGSGTACTGVARSSAAGTDGPTTANGVNGARGPPAGGSTTSGSCATGVSGCRAQTSATAASGQVVADMIAEDRISTAVQLAEQAAQAEYYAALAAEVASRADATAEQKKAATDVAAQAEQARVAASEAAELAAKPVTGAPTTTSESSAGAQCAGPECTAATAGSTTGTAGASSTTATCSAAASGCAVGSVATVSAGAAQTSSRAACPEAGCTAALTATADAAAALGEQHSRSTASGDTSCSGATACEVQISAGTTVAVSGQDVATSASVGVTCADGSAAGCATRAVSRSDATGAAGVHATSTATCETAGACQAMTSGYAGTGVAEVMASCAGTGCVTHTGGDALYSGSNARHTAQSRTDCTAGVDGQCAGSSRVAASEGSTQVSANCQASAGSTCSYSFSAASTASSATGGMTASAEATCGASGGTGGGWCATSATAETNADLAVAMAECQGSANAGCSYRYEATASKSTSHPSGSWAKARAHGSDSGTFGGGGVVVSAKVLAEDGHAYAEATCAGAPNCSTRYEAEAYAAGHFDDPQAGGTWDSWGRPRCVGGGSSGGGCGVVAVAEPGYGGGSCYGSYSSCQTPGDSVFTPYAPPPGYFYDENGNLVPESIPIGEMGEPVRSVDGKCLGFFGLCTVSAMGEDGKVVEKVCWISCTAETATGEKASYNIFTGFNGQMSTTPGGSAKDVAHGRETIHIARDADGDGEASATGGNWYITDGHTGTTTRAHAGSVRVPNPGGSARLSNPRTGSPFRVTCTGPCEWNRPSVPGLPGGDKITIDRAWSEITGRDAAGGPGKIQFEGQGYFHFSSAEGITITAESHAVTPPRATIYTPSNGRPGSYDIKDQIFSVALPNGYSVGNTADRTGVWGNGRLTAHGGTGGKLFCSGDCTATRPGEPSATFLPVVMCKNCRVGEVLPGENPRRPAGYGEVELYGDENAQGVKRYTAEGDWVVCKGAGCQFTQYNRDAAGNGGGAVCYVGGGWGSSCEGTNREGDRVYVERLRPDDQEHPYGPNQMTGRAGFVLLYPNADGTRRGQSCSNSPNVLCEGTENGRTDFERLPWHEEPNAAAINVYDPDYKLPENVVTDLVDLIELARDPGEPGFLNGWDPRTRRPLNELERAALGKANPEALARYDAAVPRAEQGVRDSASLGMAEDHSTERRIMSKHGGLVAPAAADRPAGAIRRLTDLTNAALADGLIDNAEWNSIKPLRDEIEQQAPGMLREWAPAQGRLESVKFATWTPREITTGAMEAVRNNDTVAGILGKGYDPRSGPPTDAQRQQAIDIIIEKQGTLSSRSLNLHATVYDRQLSLNDRWASWQARVDAANGRGGATPAEKAQLEREYDAMLGEQAAIEAVQAPLRAQVAAAKGELRDIDVVLAAASLNTGFHEQLSFADADLDAVHALQQRLAGSPDARQKELAGTFGSIDDLADLRYDAVRDKPYSIYGSLLGGVNLPSSGLPDITYVQTASIVYPKLEEHLGKNGGTLAKALPNLKELHPHDLVTAAAYSTDPSKAIHMDPGALEASLMGDVGFFRMAKDLSRRNLNDPNDRTGIGYWGWFADGHLKPDDWDESTRFLSPEDKAQVEADWRAGRQSVFDAVTANVANFVSTSLQTRYGSTGIGRDFSDTVGNLVVALPRAGKDLVTDVGTVIRGVSAGVTGNGEALKNLLPSASEGQSWSDVMPFTSGIVDGANQTLDKVISGDWSAYKNRPFSEGLNDLGTATLFLTPFLKGLGPRAPPGLKAIDRLERESGLGQLDNAPFPRADLPSLVPGAVVGISRPELGAIGHLADNALTGLRARPSNDLAGSVERALPQRAPRIVDESFRTEVGARSIGELTARLSGDPRFHVWEYGGQTFVRRGHPDESWVRNELGDASHDPAGSPESLFDELAEENRAIREAAYGDGANRKIRNKWPERTISTGRAGGVVNGRPFAEKIAVTSGEPHLLKGTGGEHLPVLPPDGHLIFKTRVFENTSRKYDSEPKVFEKLARDILEVGSGQSRQAVEDAIVAAIEQAPKTTDGYPVNAKDVIDAAAARLGVDLDDIDISVEMVIDFPRGRREKSPKEQVCGSCQNLMDDFEEAFRDNVTIRARNPEGETLW